MKAEIWIKYLKANSDPCLQNTCDLLDRLSMRDLEKTSYFTYCNSSSLPRPPTPFFFFLYLFTVIAPVHLYIFL